MTHPDPAYRFEQAKMADLCLAYLEAYEKGDALGTMLITGQITAQCATIYKLSPPGGLVDVPAMFRRDTGG